MSLSVSQSFCHGEPVMPHLLVHWQYLLASVLDSLLQQHLQQEEAKSFISGDSAGFYGV